MNKDKNKSQIPFFARQLGEVVDRKNMRYGNSVERSADILRVLYPDGVPVWAYRDMLLVVRIIDKLGRIANGARQDSYTDIAGYGILGAINNDPDVRMEMGKKGAQPCRNAPNAAR
jgi:hypothetical protein